MSDCSFLDFLSDNEKVHGCSSKTTVGSSEKLIDFTNDENPPFPNLKLNQFPNINLMDFSFNLVNISSDSKVSLQTSLEDENEEENSERILNQLVNDLIDQITINHNCSFNDEEEFDDKENVRPINDSICKKACKNLDFDLLEAKVEQEQHKFDKDLQRTILKEIELGIESINSNLISISNHINDNLNQKDEEKKQKVICVEIDSPLFQPSSYNHFLEDITLDDIDNNDLSPVTNATKYNHIDNIDQENEKQNVICVDINPKILTTTFYPFEDITLADETEKSLTYDREILNTSENLNKDKEQILEKNEILQDTDLLENLSYSCAINSDLQNGSQNDETSSKSDEENEHFEDAQEKLEITLTNYEMNKSITRSQNGNFLEKFNISPCQNKSVMSPNGSCEVSFSYEDRLDLLQTKLIYENKIVELQEQLEQIDRQNEKDQCDQLCRNKINYESHCHRYEEQIQNLKADSLIFKEKLTEQKSHYENIIAKLKETIDQVHLDYSTLKHKYDTMMVTQINELKEHEQLSRQFYESQNENEKLKDALLDMDLQRCQLRKTIDTLNENIHDLNRELSHISNERNQWELDHKNLASKYQDLFENHQTHVKQWDQERLNENKLNDEISILNSKIENKQKEIDDLNEKLQKQTTEIKNNHIVLNEEIVKSKEMKMLFEKSESEKEKMQEIISEIDIKMKQIEMKLYDSESEIDKMKEDNVALTENLKQSREQNEKYTLKLFDMESEIKKLKSENFKLFEIKTNLEEKRSTVEQKLFESEEHNILMELKLEQIKQKSLKMQADFDTKEKDFIKKIYDLELQLDESKNSVEQLEKNLSQECEQLRKQIQTTNSSLNEYQFLYENLTVKHESCSKISEEKDRLFGELKLIRKEHEELMKEFEVSNNFKQGLLSENTNLQKKIDRITKQLSEKNNLFQELTKKNLSLEAKLKNSEEEFKFKFDNLSQELIQSERLKINLESQVFILNTKNSTISSEFADAEKRWLEEKSLNEQKVLALQKRLDSMISNLESVKSEKQTLEETLQSLQEKLEINQSKFAEREEEFQRIEAKLKLGLQDLKEQQQKINLLTQDNRTLKASIIQCQCDKEKLHEDLEQMKKHEQELLEIKKQLESQFEKSVSEKESISIKCRQFQNKYQIAKRLVPSLQKQLIFQNDIGQKLILEIGRIMTKIDSNKKDFIRNEKVKEILRLINERVSSLTNDGSIQIDEPCEATKKLLTSEMKQQFDQSSNQQLKPPLKMRAFKPIEFDEDGNEKIVFTEDIRRQTQKPLSLNETNKENIL